MIDMYNNINLLIKPTDDCNLRCDYCFHEAYNYNNNKMKVEDFEIILSKLFKYKKIRFIWHGGEPTLMPKDFYNGVIQVQKKYGNIMENKIQTNATLLDEDYINFLYLNKFGIGVSYDGLTNNKHRGLTEETIASIENIKKIYGKVSAIKVVLKYDLDNIIDCYKHFNTNEINIQFNPLISSSNPLQNFNDYFDEKYYCEKMFQLFVYWMEDEESKIIINPLYSYLLSCIGINKLSCQNNSCLSKFLSINYKGDIYPCSRYYTEKYILGNIKNVNSIDEVFESDAFNNLVLGSINRRKSCNLNCDLYDYCEGGCNSDAINNGNLENNNFSSCKIFRTLFKEIKNYLNEFDINLIKNKCLQNKIINEKREHYKKIDDSSIDDLYKI